MDETGIMAHFEQEAHSFLIRLWHEHHLTQESSEWRGWIDHVQSGQRHYFQDTAAIGPIIGHYLSQPPELDDIFKPIQLDKKDIRDD